MTTELTSPIALVGAYERENFGDILFLLRTREYLAGLDSIPTAPVGREATTYLSDPVEEYVPIFQDGDVRAIWVVGGEVGGTSVEDAVRMSIDGWNELMSTAKNRGERDRRLLERTGLGWSESPYLPRASAYRGTRSVPTIINSVGVSAIERLRWDRRETVLSVLRDAEHLSVRDKESARVLRELNIPHRVAPDLVHTLALSAEYGDHRPRTDRVVLIQLKERVLAEYGAEALAELIARSRTLAGWTVRFFSAGSAPGHDSMELYRQTTDHLRRIDPSRRVELSTTLDPVEKVREIAGADLWVGTSLHGLIVSTAFGVPRVGLALSKLQTYADTWGETMPITIDIGELDAAAESALSQSSRALLDRALELGRIADENMKAAVEVVTLATPSEDRTRRRVNEAARLERARRSPVRKLAHAARALR